MASRRSQSPVDEGIQFERCLYVHVKAGQRCRSSLDSRHQGCQIELVSIQFLREVAETFRFDTKPRQQ